MHDTITLDEYMVWPLPPAVYGRAVSTANSTKSSRHKPTHVFKWVGFKESVVEWIAANHENHSQRVQRPVFIPRVITEEVQTLQPFIQDNLLDISSRCFIPPSEFTARRQIESCRGEPDHLMTRSGNIIALVEEKGRWTLNDSDIVGTYSTANATAAAIHQLYHYMRLNHRMYGILTSYENTWFMYRSVDCSVCENPGHETLYITDGFSFASQGPSVLQCIAYFNTIVNSDFMPSPPTSKVDSRANPTTQVSRPSSPAISPSGSISRGVNPLSFGIPTTDLFGSHQQPQDFDADDFHLDKVLGQGRSKVYLDYYESEPIALKVADIVKRREMLPELLNEVSIYEHLSQLQGNGIPRFILHGLIEDILYCVGVSICGRVVEVFTDDQKQKLMNTLDNIHKAGILHNDIKKENILIDESGKPFIIDFGFASKSSSFVAQMEERNLLLSLIEST
ncbi:kinase-like domain-containing protein [Globomyces pollinis-pini]|nr:kinase-like domain-containing protein [Globomyces pollinis-pini]